MFRLYLALLVLAVALAAGCDDAESPPGPNQQSDTLTITCPSDTVIPINCPSHPDSLGMYPDVQSSCMADPYVIYADSFIPGGIRRTWITADTCGNSDICIQSIGQGAPGTCD